MGNQTSRHFDIVLALEHENTSSVENILNDELQKLLDIKASLKVLFLYPTIPVFISEGECTHPEIKEKIESAKITNQDERYVIISCVYVGKPNAIEVSACVFDSSGRGEDLEPFQVKYISEG